MTKTKVLKISTFPNIAENFRRCSDDFRSKLKINEDVLTTFKRC